MSPDNAEAAARSALYGEMGGRVDDGLKASFLDYLGEAVIGTDASGRIVYWNDSAARLYGWSPDEVIGSNVLEITPAAEMRESAGRILVALRRGESWSGEIRTRHRDGTDFHAVVTSSPVLDKDGELVAVVAISRDISGQRDAESALQTTEERLDLVRRASQSVIWEMDVATRRIEWSDTFRDVFGYDPEAITPTFEWWMERVHPEDQARLERGFQAFLEDDAQFWTEEYRFRRADGTYADVFDRTFSSPSASGEKSRIAGAMVDLTKQRRLQDERRVLAQAGMILDLSLDYESTLPTVTRLVANVMADFCLVHLLPAAHVQPFTTATHADPGCQDLLDGVVETISAAPDDGSLIGRVLHTREPVLLSNVPVALREGAGTRSDLRDLVLQLEPTSLLILPIQARLDVLGFMILGGTSMRSPYDENDLRMAEELARRVGTAIDHARLYEAEQLANRAKADFLAVMSHELRTPLTAVLGYADLLHGEVSGPLNELQKQQVQRIRAGTDRLHRLMETILMYVRLETEQERANHTRASLQDLLDRVREIVEPRAAEESLEFRIETGDLPSHITTDPDRFLQVLLGLLTNALKFAHRGTIVLRADARDGYLDLDVCDNGPGIPEEHQPYVFNTFWQVEQPSTRRAGGAGLGLSVARRLARLLGGDVVIAESSPAGTTFRFRLPLVSSA